MAYEMITMLFAAGEAILFLLALATVIKNRKFERTDMEMGINALIFSLFLLLVGSIVAIIANSLVTFTGLAAIPDLTTYISYLQNVTTLGVLPLAAAALLVAVLIAKDRLTPVAEKKEADPSKEPAKA